MSVKYKKEHFLFQGPPQITPIGIFGMQIYHLATLVDIKWREFVTSPRGVPQSEGPPACVSPTWSQLLE
jgi:hypothetical protein